MPDPDALPTPRGGPSGRAKAAVVVTAGHVILVSRYVASRLAAARIEAFALVPGVVAALGSVLVLVRLLGVGEDLVLAAGVTLLVLGGIGAGAILGAAAIVRRLGLSRRSRPLARAMDQAWDRLRRELTAAGVPVGLGTLLGFLWALVRGHRPHHGLPARALDVATRFTEIVDAEGLRAQLDAAARATVGAASAPAPGSSPPGGAS